MAGFTAADGHCHSYSAYVAHSLALQAIDSVVNQHFKIESIADFEPFNYLVKLIIIVMDLKIILTFKPTAFGADAH